MSLHICVRNQMEIVGMRVVSCIVLDICRDFSAESQVLRWSVLCQVERMADGKLEGQRCLREGANSEKSHYDSILAADRKTSNAEDVRSKTDKLELDSFDIGSL